MKATTELFLFAAWTLAAGVLAAADSPAAAALDAATDGANVTTCSTSSRPARSSAAK